MVSLTGTLTAVTTLAGGLWALCATVFATAGWTAPACLAAGFATGVDLILGIVNDVPSKTSTNSNDPDSKRSSQVQWFRVHSTGDMESFDGRLPELRNTNETVTMLDAERGYLHTVWIAGDYVKVKTDFTQNSITRRNCQAGSAQRDTTKCGLEKRLTPKQKKHELTEATYSAQNIAGDVGGDTKANANILGRNIANKAYKLGTWCVSILDGSKTVADIGLTLGGPGYSPPDEEPPCRA